MLQSRKPISPILCREAPDKFLQHKDLFFQNSQNNYRSADNCYLSKEILADYEKSKLTEESFTARMILWKKLNEIAQREFPDHGLLIGGSTLTGFGTTQSDVDITLIKADYDSERQTAKFFLTRLLPHLKKQREFCRFEFVDAMVPIIKFHDSSLGINVDLNYNNSINIKNTHLLIRYARADWRVQPLAFIIKKWANFHGINDARNHSISSYSFMLMMIHYLQFGAEPPVLPCLQKLCPRDLSPICDVQDLNFFVTTKHLQSIFNCRNQQSLADLFIGFLKYYKDFNFKRYTISVKSGQPIDRFDNLSQGFGRRHYVPPQLNIEEPFTGNNTARSTFDTYVFLKIQRVFNSSYTTLYTNRTLSSIFTQKF